MLALVIKEMKCIMTNCSCDVLIPAAMENQIDEEIAAKVKAKIIVEGSIAIMALEAGKHVLCEKPPALNVAGAIKMKDAADKNAKLLMFGFVRRFAQNTQVLEKFIKQGQLGDIYYVKTGFLRRCGNPGGWFANSNIWVADL